MTDHHAGSGTLIDLLVAHAGDRDRVFASVQDRSGAIYVISYAEQLERVRRAAGALTGLGVGPGDRVHVQLSNCVEFYDVWFATTLIGATIVPTSPLSTADELSYIFADAQPALSLVEPEQVELAKAAAGGTAVVAVRGGRSWESLTRDVEPAALRSIDSSRAASILYTSGTTSRPKGVLVTGANYLAVGRAVAEHLKVRADDRWHVVLPLFHANAQYYCSMSALVSGASVTVIPRFSASSWGRQAVDHAATLGSLFAAPIRMILAAEAGRPPTPTRLRAVLFAQNLTDQQARSFEDHFGTRLLQLYGMTETILPPTMNPNSDERRWDSIGEALGGTRIRLVDGAGHDVDPGRTGELLVRGAPGVSIAGGYLNQPAATAQTFADGWLHSGDLARMDSDGFYYFVDRSKDMIKRSGENIAASEVERVVDDHPAVVECAAIAIPDPTRDQAVVVYVVLLKETSADEDDLLTWCRDRLASFKVPSAFVFLDALPRTSVGKVRKEDLRASEPPDAVNVKARPTTSPQ